jgi:hypothetical protein
MNSLPFISHHLFVAAVGNEGRVLERDTRREKPPAGLADQAAELALQVVDARKPMPAITNSVCRARITQARA